MVWAAADTIIGLPGPDHGELVVVQATCERSLVEVCCDASVRDAALTALQEVGFLLVGGQLKPFVLTFTVVAHLLVRPAPCSGTSSS